ncbi:uncharacterized protein LOC117336324 [Pecten maximus]|uniref:uncharacterized protein LOC117336324 n=1 Tax=Pecten maximus TaxID=6579 RepID=UPI0014591A06|nr:uncharacterized protein LOC117336324 [Pecten maximus]
MYIYKFVEDKNTLSGYPSTIYTMMMLFPAVLVSLIAFATAAHPTVPQGDHLLVVLQAAHSSKTFNQLPAREQIFLVELIAAAETDTVTHYVDRVGFDRLLQFLDHVNQINQVEAHQLEKYLIQELGMEETTTVPGLGRRSLQDVLSTITNNAAFKALSTDDQNVMLDLAKAAESGTATQYVEQVGYSRILALVEHIMAPSETHVFLHYLSTHIATELGHNHHHGPVVG